MRSNTVAIADVIAKRPTTLSFHTLPTGYALHDMHCQTTPGVDFGASPVSAAELAAAPALASLDIANPMIVELDDQGDDHDPAVRETEAITITANGKTGKIELLETAPDSGVFAGALPASGSYAALSACDLTLIRSGNVTLSFARERVQLRFVGLVAD